MNKQYTLNFFMKYNNQGTKTVSKAERGRERESTRSEPKDPLEYPQKHKRFLNPALGSMVGPIAVHR